MKKALTVSIVIPVYNEEGYIGGCLDAIAAQTVKPHQVIVVDNNCTDQTLKIIKKYPFVTVLKERKQGQVFAQATGFNHATGQVLARIDADTHIPTNWIQRVLKGFEDNPTALALTGPGEPYDVPLKKAGKLIFNFYHGFLSKLFSGREMLWGSNCAIRTSAWEAIKESLHYQPDIWEDYDMSFHLPAGAVKSLAALRITCSFRAAHKSLPEQFRYQYRNVRTYALHQSTFRVVVYCFVWYSMLLLAPLALMDRYLWLLTKKKH